MNIVSIEVLDLDGRQALLTSNEGGPIEGFRYSSTEVYVESTGVTYIHNSEDWFDIDDGEDRGDSEDAPSNPMELDDMKVGDLTLVHTEQGLVEEYYTQYHYAFRCSLPNSNLRRN